MFGLTFVIFIILQIFSNLSIIQEASEQISVSDEKANVLNMKLLDSPPPSDGTGDVQLMLDDLDQISGKRCDSAMSLISTSNSTITPR